VGRAIWEKTSGASGIHCRHLLLLQLLVGVSLRMVFGQVFLETPLLFFGFFENARLLLLVLHCVRSSAKFFWEIQVFCFLAFRNCPASRAIAVTNLGECLFWGIFRWAGQFRIKLRGRYASCCDTFCCCCCCWCFIAQGLRQMFFGNPGCIKILG
jgi:hypothetical protein